MVKTTLSSDSLYNKKLIVKTYASYKKPLTHIKGVSLELSCTVARLRLPS